MFRVILFFFPHHYIGGAERVHLEIIKSLKRKPFVFFDSTDGTSLSDELKQNAYCFFIITQKRKRYLTKILIFLSYIMPLTLFGCNSSFFYKTISKVKKRVRTIDLTHAFSFPERGIEILSLPYVHLIDIRIVINNKTFEDYKQLYRSNNVKSDLLSRFRIIENGIKIYDFDKEIIEKRFDNFIVGFVGRNSSEKRPELFFNLVKKNSVKAKVIGDCFENFKSDFPNVDYYENCNNPKLIREQFSGLSLLLVSSRREGFPLVIMEAMELGIPVISTDVGSISKHVIENDNGFLGPVEEEEFLIFATEKINKLRDNKELYVCLSLKAREHAIKKFDIENFNTQYRELFYE